MRTTISTTDIERETRRRIAGRLLLESQHALQEVADLVGASLSSVKRWKRTALEGGLDALATKPRPGRPAALMLAGPIQAGYRTDLWTCKRVGEVIYKEFGVEYHEPRIKRGPAKIS